MNLKRSSTHRITLIFFGHRNSELAKFNANIKKVEKKRTIKLNVIEILIFYFSITSQLIDKKKELTLFHLYLKPTRN